MPAAIPIATLAVGAFSAKSQSSAARKAANAQQAASDAATAEQRRQYDQTRADQRPFMEAGYDALGRQQQALDGDFSGFQNSPDYAYSMQQMQKGIERGAAARGALYNGGTTIDLASGLNGLANQNFNNYWNRLAGRAGQGQVSATNLGGLGAMMAGNIGNNMMNAANARASSYQNSANATTGAAFGALGAFNNWYGNNSAQNGGGSGFYFGSRPGPG